MRWFGDQLCARCARTTTLFSKKLLLPGRLHVRRGERTALESERARVSELRSAVNADLAVARAHEDRCVVCMAHSMLTCIYVYAHASAHIFV